MTAYAAWIAANYPTADSARNQCNTATRRMIADFPELKRVRGHYGGVEHWWCVTADREIIDPTVAQFSKPCEYRPVDESKPQPTGYCMWCRELCWDHEPACSPECHEQLRLEFSCG